MKNLINICFFYLILVSTACGPYQDLPDVKAIQPSFDIIRIDRAISEVDSTELFDVYEKLNRDYPKFSAIYFDQLLKIRTRPQDSLSKDLSAFIFDPIIVHIGDTIADLLSDFEDLRPELYEAFQYYQYYFPERSVPNIYCFNSGFDYQGFLFEDEGRDGVGIGLEFFLGADFPYKRYFPKNPSFSSYLTRTYDTRHLPRKVIAMLVEDLLGSPSGNRMIDLMIHHGKKLYILDQCLPMENDTIIIEYTADQLQWCQENESQIWSHFYEKDLFYETNSKKINKLVFPSPNVNGMPKEAPGRVANYMGWQIVKAWMYRNPDMDLHDLIAMRDAQQLLDESKYKPRKR